MKKEMIPFTIISNKYELEIISKKILDSNNIEIVPLEKVIDKKILKQLKTEKENPYKQIYDDFMNIFNSVNRTPKPKVKEIDFPMIIDKDEISNFSEKLNTELENISNKMSELSEKKEILSKEIELFEKLKNIDIDVSDLKKMKRLKYRIGKLNKLYFERFCDSIKKENIISIILDSDEVNTWVFIIYDSNLKIEKILSIANFVEYKINEDYAGYPKDILLLLYDEYKSIEYEIEMLNMAKKKIFFENRRFIYKYFDYIFVLKNIYDLAQNVKFTENFFVISGWTTRETYQELEKHVNTNDYILLLRYAFNDKAPTILNNKGFFKHFEFIVKMFGVPSSDEIDPTPLITLMFLFFYGMMFGDVGHGFILSALGFWLYKKKGSDLFYVIGASGLSSMLFGVLYGSVFGFEDIIHPLWKRPMDNINYFLLLSVYFGIAIITVAMILNIANRIRRGEKSFLLFDPNGISGIALYWILLGSVFYMMKNGVFPKISYIFIITLVVLIYLRSILFEEGKFGEKIVQGFFDLFEVLLGYLSNTLSFIRLGAFAMNHAGLFLAFYMMAKMTNNPVSSFVILLLGNIIIIVLEGLVVFIQTLRLEYYEFFTRFFKGDGKEFNPIKYKF
ncbi:archaeal/vacuolar-type H+-ATPase subunit I [Marinitoga piezophila KA3]|uniref:Archaeal/vacuolar-type H+-ATPase subunit I n=1 Tax=Marinitoga piezophila (strain DSM 14283 / JCM 11233 / KA3) TaxID=443254 RepID=H2J5M1_MARPK|nr:V-type ATPase 116kDa subunit family protein [Marinitoga piezophila]AEX85007.1 archaeal/vacuolar-type H+-ATPase subunit I [Marinitoga piezophila KA3]